MGDFRAIDGDLDLWRLISQLRHAIYKARTKELNKYNISYRQSSAMYVIKALGNGATPVKISRWLLRERHSVSELINRMEKQGLVRKSKDLDRKNLVRVVLTEKGHEAHYQTTRLESIHRIMSALSQEERQQLRASLEKLWRQVLEELGIEYRQIFPQSLPSENRGLQKQR